jgi:hypothetical protein
MCETRKKEVASAPSVQQQWAKCGREHLQQHEAYS